MRGPSEGISVGNEDSKMFHIRKLHYASKLLHVRYVGVKDSKVPFSHPKCKFYSDRGLRGRFRFGGDDGGSVSGTRGIQTPGLHVTGLQNCATSSGRGAVSRAEVMSVVASLSSPAVPTQLAPVVL